MIELVERETALQTLRRCLQDAQHRGHVALVAGEAGIGKTSLLRALAGAHDAVWWGACDALQTPHPLQPLLDIAGESGARFAARLAEPRPALFEAVLDELRLAPTPVLVVIEDAHWADDATLDLLKFLGRRIERTRALLAVSYRDDEVPASHPLRRVIGELPAAALTRVDLPRLTPAGVETLAQRAARPADGVHAVTLGNPFFVTEMLRESGLAVPRTVQDLVLGRLSRLPASAQELMRLVCVVPGRTERWLADELLGARAADLELCIDAGLLQADETTLSFRHELGRVAVESALSVPAREALNERVLGALAAEGREVAPARLVHHAAAARNTAAVSRFAPLAAAQAQQRDAHREAAAHWGIALRLGTPPGEDAHRHWLEQYATECTTTGRASEAMQARRTLESTARAHGDIAGAAVQLARQAILHVHQLRQTEGEALNRQALEMLAPLPESIAHAQVWYQTAGLRMLDRDCADSVAMARRAMALAESLGDRELAARASSTMGTALMFIDYEAGCAELQSALQMQLDGGHVQAAAATLTNLGSGSGELMQLRNAERWLRDAIGLCAAHELDYYRSYSSAWLAICLLLRGCWDETATFANVALADAQASDTARLMALLALARLRLRRGDPGADSALDEALAMIGPGHTLQRIAPLRAARAEAAYGRADLAATVTEAEEALPLAQAKRHAWFIGELSYWRWRAGAIADAPAGCAEPYALEIGGRWREAAAAWQRLDCPYERARALADGNVDAQREALAVFEALGTGPAADALRRRLREAGVRGVARGARPSTRSHPCALTAAEFKVLALMGHGLRNAQIAARLHRSVRTIDHHVEAILAKLGVGSRHDAVRRAEREGWFAQSGQKHPAN